MATTTRLDDLTAALDAMAALVAGVSDDEWSLPTPCGEWAVRDIVNHVASGNLIFAELVRQGEVDRSAYGGDLLGEDAVTAFRSSADALVAAFAEPEAMTRVLPLPIGDAPGAVGCELRLVETVAHGWDLAKALGRPAEIPDGAVERSLAFSGERLANVPVDRKPFAASVEVPDDAPAVDRLVALLGRDPRWLPPVDGQA